MLLHPLVDLSSPSSISRKPKGLFYVFLGAIMPFWDSTIAPLSSEDLSGHHNLLGSSATAPPGITANALTQVLQ